MHAASADWTEFAPPQPPAQLRALALAVLAHVLLLGALGWGVTWRHQADRTLTVEAELWSAVPQQAGRQLEMAEVIGGELLLVAAAVAAQRGGHHARVVDQQV